MPMFPIPPGEPFAIPYKFWDPATTAIPSLYWDVFSDEQRYHALCKELGKNIAYDEYQTGKINLNREDIDTLQALFQQFQESGFDDYYRAQIEQWVRDHMREIIEQAIKMVFFGLTDDGYFCAYIPKSWQGILFDTIANYADENYGCLVLSY